MIRKIVLLFAVALFALTSCKKGEVTRIENKNPTPVPVPGAQMPKPPRPADGKYPVMSFAALEHDFGTIKKGEKVNYTFKFENTGEADLLISNAVGSCGCTIPEFPKDPIKPGESGELKVSFNSAGKHGEQKKTVTVLTNTESGQEKLTIKASINEGSGIANTSK